MVNFGYPYNDIIICKDSTDYDYLDLSYIIEECLAANDYFTDWQAFKNINPFRPLILHINKSRTKYLFKEDDNQIMINDLVAVYQ